MKERPEQADPAIVVGLKQHGLLQTQEDPPMRDRKSTR